MSPGPPGLMNIEPIRCLRLVARWRISASWIVRPFGWSRSSSTRIRAHCRRGPGGSHGAQWIRLLTAWDERPDGASAVSASPAESATASARIAARAPQSFNRCMFVPRRPSRPRSALLMTHLYVGPKTVRRMSG